MACRAEPVRTCVGCRSRAASAELLRIVAVDGELVPDVRRRLPGRGAHLHPDPVCLDLAERRKAFQRALRLPGPPRTARVRAHVELAVQALSGEPATRTSPGESGTTGGAPPGARQGVYTEAGRDSDERSMRTQP